MSTTRVPLKKALNLIQLKEEMDGIVFNYIDTSQKWDVAHTQLDELLKNAIDYFDSYTKANGDLPKENTYWVLFLNFGYKLIYFHTISYYQLKGCDNEEVKERVVELLTLAANCIPNVKKRSHGEFLNEIARSLEEIQQEPKIQGEFEKSILEQNNQVKDCILSFAKATKFFLK
jgi:hypothetical protein